jgi:hypothetical protein
VDGVYNQIFIYFPPYQVHRAMSSVQVIRCIHCIRSIRSISHLLFRETLKPLPALAHLNLYPVAQGELERSDGSNHIILVCG